LDSQTIATHPEEEHAKHPPYLHHHFATVEQQKETSTFGMWLFLLTEIMFFGGLFCAYLIYQLVLPGFRRRQPLTVDRAGCDEYGGADLLELHHGHGRLLGRTPAAQGFDRMAAGDNFAGLGVPWHQGD
jgi:hypothetical protein